MKKIFLMLFIVSGLFADIGKVAVVKGEATIDRSEKTIKVYNNMNLLKHDIVETEQGRLQMLFIDNTVISLGRESRFVIEDYLYVNNSKKVAATFKIETGFIKMITGSIGKVMPSMFVLNTPTSQITPNGTIWSVKVEKNREEYRVLEGKITLRFEDNSKEQNVVLKAGEAMVLDTVVKGNKQIVKNQRKLKIESNKEEKTDKNIEQNIANFMEKQDMSQGTIITEEGIIVDVNPIDDGNNGHGIDPGGFDPSNPGRGHSKK
jgi:hypothetical protein